MENIRENNQYTARALVKRQNRCKQVRRNIIILILSAFLITAAILLISFSTQATDREHRPSYKYYKSIEVVKGDTLWSIARSNMDSKHYKNTREYIAEVKTMNSLSSDKIIAGSHIIIPYYSSEFIQD